MSEYDKALKVLMKSPVTDDMIRFLTNCTLKVLPTPAQNYPTPPGSPGCNRLPSLMSFISRLVRHTNVYTSTLLTTACYLNRLKCVLPRDASGVPSTIHRIFLACLILSAKFHNDSSPLNKHWAKYTDGLFTVHDVNLMERQLVQLLNWDLRVTNDDLILDLRQLLEPIVDDIERTARHRRKLQRYPLRRNGAGAVPYEHQRNISVCSDLSSATLVESASNSSLRLDKEIWTQPGPELPTSLSSESLVDRSSWTMLEHDLNQLLLQHGF